MPACPSVTLPGLALAWAMNSFSVFAAKSFLMAIRPKVLAIIATGTNASGLNVRSVWMV